MTAKAVADGNPKLPHELRGQIATKCDEIVRRVKEGTLDAWWVINALQRVVEGRLLLGSIGNFPIWREVTLVPKTADEFTSELEQAECSISDQAKSIMRKPEFATLKEAVTFKLARVEIMGLGFTERPTTDQLWERIRKLGGMLLPPEAGPQLRKDYTDQPKGDEFFVAMKRIFGSSNHPRSFHVSVSDLGGIRWLSAVENPDRWDLDDEIVFAIG